MNSGDRFWLMVCAILGTAAIIITVAICGTIRLNTRDYIRGGYTMESLPGQTLPRWVKK
jgi:hypothetical protein